MSACSREQTGECCLAIAHAAAGIVRCNVDGRISIANPAIHAMLGYGEGELHGLSCCELAWPEDLSADRALAAELREGQRAAYTIEKRLLRKDGRPLWVNLSAAAIRDPQGGLSGVVYVLEDLTRRKESELALAEARERTAMAQAAGRVGVFDWNPITGKTVWNDELEKLFGLVPGSHEGDHGPWAKDVAPDDVRWLEPLMAQWMQSQRREAHFEYRFFRPDGEMRWMSAQARFFYDPAGACVRVVGTTIDITDQRRTAEALRQSEERFRIALQHTAISVHATDTNLRYTWIHNPPYGLSVERMLGKRDEELLPPEAVADLVSLKRQVLQSGQGLRRQVSMTVQGQSLCYDCTIEPTYDSFGAMSGLIVALMDVTEFVAARYAAEEASRAKDHFLAVLSHELRTPLAPVLTTVQMIEAQGDLSDDLRESLGLIRRNVEMEARLIDDLLDVTRISRGKLELHVTATCVHDAIRNVVATCHGELHAKSQHLVLDLSATRHCVHGDPGRIQQVFWNLVKNASKFTPPDGTITVSTRDAADGGLLIHVLDNGMGIEPEHLVHIFDAFEQGDRSVTRTFGGLGLGLSISRGLMELHGGSLTASSAGRGLGSTFTAGFPPAITFAALSVANGPDMPSRHNDASCEILLVEDHADTAHALARVLKTLGHRVRIAQSVAEAIAAAAEPFDLLICDIGLPDGNGLDLMKQLREARPVRAIALSGFGMEEDIRKSEEAGFLAHLTKPVDLAQLEAAIGRLGGVPAPR